MRAIDTNVLVRLLTRDDARQVQEAETFVMGGAWVSQLVLAETVWVLDAVYGRTAEQIAAALDMLLHHEQLSLQDAEVVEAALVTYRRRPKLGFSDCLALEIARKAGHLPLGTFDGSPAELPNAQRLAP